MSDPPVTPTSNGPAGLTPSPDAGVTVSAAFAFCSAAGAEGDDGASGAALQAVKPSSKAKTSGLNTCSPKIPSSDVDEDAWGLSTLLGNLRSPTRTSGFPPIEAPNWPVMTCSAMTNHTLG
ncbi:hypothetical protein GCM10017774_24600 [Lentzea cavernae]|uniref:Uncharacterized protein n=1 Tax=Lentzea cavernae TaxID=2020703 RepID=A0ABQ3MC20_9PSEU|nr:hypothetical protein GCM10017774_24600 [Lentzea cavernae]